MKIYETVVTSDRKIVLENIPLQPGEKVKLLIIGEKHARKGYSLRGKKVEYVKPFDSVAEDEWETLNAVNAGSTPSSSFSDFLKE